MDLAEGWWEDERNPHWRGEDGVFDPAALTPPNKARLAESRKLVLEVLGECIQDVQWMLDNPEDPVVRRKRLYPPRDDSSLATQTFHSFENLPLELQVMVWEEHVASREQDYHHDTSHPWSCGQFWHFMHKRRNSEDFVFHRHRFVAPEAKTMFYYTWSPPAAIAVCRFSRLRALKAWSTEVAGFEEEPSCRCVSCPSIKATVLQVLGELAEEVEERLICCSVRT